MSKSRNVNGKGTTYHDSERNLWVHQISYTDPETGIFKRKKFSAKQKKIAVARGDDFLKNLNQGLLPSSENVTIGQWVHEWLFNYCKHKVRARTFTKYASCLNLYIVAKFSNTLLKDLKALTLQKHFNNLLINGRVDGKPLSSLTLRGTRRYFTMCLDSAVKNGLLLKNIARDTEPAKLYKKDIIVLSNDEIERLICEARKTPNSFMREVLPVVIILTVNTGLRLGEIFGLKWQDISFEENCLYVKRALSYILGQGLVMQEPKSKASKRRILLTATNLQMLLEYKEWQNNYAKGLYNQYEKMDLVFPNMFGKPMDTGNFTNRYFKPLLKNANINNEFTFHGLRHTHATLLLKQKVNPKVIQERLGHSTISMTLDIYSHVLPDMQDEAVEALNNIFNK